MVVCGVSWTEQDAENHRDKMDKLNWLRTKNGESVEGSLLVVDFKNRSLVEKVAYELPERLKENEDEPEYCGECDLYGCECEWECENNECAECGTELDCYDNCEQCNSDNECELTRAYACDQREDVVEMFCTFFGMEGFEDNYHFLELAYELNIEEQSYRGYDQGAIYNNQFCSPQKEDIKLIKDCLYRLDSDMLSKEGIYFYEYICEICTIYLEILEGVDDSDLSRIDSDLNPMSA